MTNQIGPQGSFFLANQIDWEMIIRFKYINVLSVFGFFSSLDFGFNGIHCCNSCGDGGGVDDVVGVVDDGSLADMNHDDRIHNTILFLDYDVEYNHGYRNNGRVP